MKEIQQTTYEQNQAYYSINRKKLFDVMRKFGIQTKTKKASENLHDTKLNID